MNSKNLKYNTKPIKLKRKISKQMQIRLGIVLTFRININNLIKIYKKKQLKKTNKQVNWH